MQNPSILKLDVHVISPVIVLPFSSLKPGGELWVLNLGDLSLCTNDACIKPNLTREESAFDIYDVSLKNIKMQYYSSALCYEEGSLRPPLK